MRVCEICKKATVIQKSGAHQYGGGWAMRATKKRRVWLVNLHKVKVTYPPALRSEHSGSKTGGGVRRTMRLCTKCLRRVKAQMKKTAPAKKEVPSQRSPTLTPAAPV